MEATSMLGAYASALRHRIRPRPAGPRRRQPSRLRSPDRHHRPPGQQLVPDTRRRAALGRGPGDPPAGASPEAIQILLEEVSFSWHETLGVPPNADAGTIRRAWARLAHAHHPDKGGTQEQMARLNAAYERAGRP